MAAASSPQHGLPLTYGRPRLPSKQDLLDFAFGVPDSPPSATRGRKALAEKMGKLLLEDPEERKVPPSPARKGTSSSVQSQRSTMEMAMTAAPEDSPATSAKQAELDREIEMLPFKTMAKERHEVCEKVLLPWSYLMKMPGKNVRDMLIEAFNQWIGCGDDQLILIKQVVAYLHSASLIVDDIEDESATRRGYPAAHVKFGVAPALNAANYVYFLALEKLLTLQCPYAVQGFTVEMCNLHRGQGRDIFWRDTAYIASQDEYIEMVQDKTGGLFRLAIKVMYTVASETEPSAAKYNLDKDDGDDVEEDKQDLAESPRKIATPLAPLLHLANNLASFFQIRDDLINLASPEFHKKKGFCEDITEGKFSFIALHSLRTLMSAKNTRKYDELLDILQLKTTDPATIRRALAIIESTKSFTYTLAYLDELKTSAEAAIKKLGGNKQLSELIRVLAMDLEDCKDVQKRVIEAKAA